MKYIVTLNGTDYEVEVDELKEAIVTNVAPASAPVVAEPVAPAAAPVAPAAAPVSAPAAPVVSGSGTPVKSPMPGTILSVNVSEGKTVAEGDVLFILEAMKMENEIVAPAGGTVNKIVTAKGSSVATDEVLAFIG